MKDTYTYYKAENDNHKKISDDIDRREWEDFIDTGLLWFVNVVLHLFGWAIAVEHDHKKDGIIEVYPARIKIRGFSESSAMRTGYKLVSQYLKENIDDLVEEASKED